jgi:hypothetical protein
MCELRNKNRELKIGPGKLYLYKKYIQNEEGKLLL